MTQYMYFNKVTIQRDTDEVLVRGVDLGGKATLHYMDTDTLVIKVAGHSAWAGLGRDREYVPAHFEVYKHSEWEYDEYGNMVVHLSSKVVEFPVKRDR